MFSQVSFKVFTFGHLKLGVRYASLILAVRLHDVHCSAMLGMHEINEVN